MQGLPKHADIAAVAQANILPQLPLSDTTEGMGQATAEAWLVDHLARWESGYIQGSCHRSIVQLLKSVDPLLTLRWDFDEQKYSIDRYAPELGCYLTIFYWSHTLGEGGAIRAILLASDMQRYDTPQDYHSLKQELVDAALKRQDKARAEAALAAVDQLTDARIRNFMAVERAMQIGEKVNVTGEDARWLNKSYDLTQRGLIPEIDPRACVNPSMHPFKHRRMSRKGGYNISTGNDNG